MQERWRVKVGGEIGWKEEAPLTSTVTSVEVEETVP